jgi:hypothetical protein
MVAGIALTTLLALGLIPTEYVGGMSHIHIAIPAFIYTIFAQAFVMFYFIGVSRLIDNVYLILSSGRNLQELFEEPPADLAPYLTKVKKFVYDSTLAKRKTIPWTMLMLVLGMAAFLLGGAYDTGLVAMTTHSGVVYGFLVAMLIGFFRQWYYLGQSHKLLRKVKTLFQIPDGQM